MEYEVKQLQKQLGEKESKEYKDNYERLKFNEGSLWMVGRCLSEVQNLHLKIQEIVTDFQTRMKPTFMDIEVNPKTLQLAVSWFIQTLDKIVLDYIDKFKDWQFTTNKNVDNLNGTLGSY
jgi:chloramphenicol O-acetyltransferase